MCGRINLSDMTAVELADYFQTGRIPKRLITNPDPRWENHYNVAPTVQVPIIRTERDGLRLDMARWWFVPSFFRKPIKEWQASTFNARIETVASSPTFRAAYQSNRCVQPAAGFYEWLNAQGKKTPFYIHPTDGAPALMFAALWSDVNLPDYQKLTCTIITEPAHPSFAHLHDRMPVMLDLEGMDMWLAGLPLEDIPRKPVTSIAWHQVSDRVNNSRNSDPGMTDPV